MTAASVIMADRRSNPAADDRVFSQEVSEELRDRVLQFARHSERLRPEITSWWTNELRWGRNRATLASDRRDRRVWVTVGPWDDGMTTNQHDDVSLRNAVQGFEGPPLKEDPADLFPYKPPVPQLPMPKPVIWSDATYNVTPEVMGEIARGLVKPAEAQGLLSAGYMEMRAGTRLWLAGGDWHYQRFTQAQCSMTVRDTQGTGSGWAGLSSYDWAKIDAPALAQLALEKCVASRNPVALEPGRYTVILEPQAVADLLEVFVQSFLRPADPGAEGGVGPWALSYDTRIGDWRTKLGLRVVDERLTLSHDPMDPLLGIMPEPGMVPLNWIENGVLTNLQYGRRYAVGLLKSNLPARSPYLGYRLSGGTTSMDEMIATTTRGLLVTRFWGVREIDGRSLLSTGLTRDGVWLIENGKITKPVKNFRFSESPLFMLNQVEQLGVPVPVFRPVKEPDVQPGDDGAYMALMPAVVPPIKARDFSFTAMADAV